jgi:hypothetical protein
VAKIERNWLILVTAKRACSGTAFDMDKNPLTSEDKRCIKP